MTQGLMWGRSDMGSQELRQMKTLTAEGAEHAEEDAEKKKEYFPAFCSASVSLARDRVCASQQGPSR